MRRRYPTRGARGFTLTELLVVMVIIVLLAGVAVTYVPKRIEDARVARTRSDIRVIENALQQYQIYCQDVPSQADGLKALVSEPSNPEHRERWQKKGPFLQHGVPKDGWGRDYIYRTPGRHSKDFDLLSVGKDGKEGTDDDVCNWETWSE